MDHPYSTLSPAQEAVRNTVLRYGQVSSSQLRRLHYAHKTFRGSRKTCAEHLKKLSERGVIHRLPYRLAGYGKGFGEYVYAPPGSGARYPNLHTLDITELYVRLWEATRGAVRYDPEPWAPTSWAGHPITADAYVRLPGAHYFVEVDNSSEAPSVISAKMNRYVKAVRATYVDEDAPDSHFPQVIWLAHDRDRIRTLQRQAKAKGEPDLFVCMLFEEAVGRISGQS